MTTVLVFGTFDILHPGHVKFLTAARRHGDRLTVIVTRDAKVHHEKGHAPIMNEQERIAIISSLKPVTRAILGDKVGEWTILTRLKPDVVCVGYDQKIPTLLLSSPAFQAGDLKFIKLPRFKTHTHSSTLIKKRIRRALRQKILKTNHQRP